MELNREEIIKALECCVSSTGSDACVGCPFNKDDICHKDTYALEKSALALIKELTEENERLREFASSKCEECAGCTADKCDCANIEADTVRKMQKKVKDLFPKEDWFTSEAIDQIAKEMLEGDEGK